MSKLEVLCATMHQKDFSKIKEMNIQSDIIFANQADRNSYDEIVFNGYKARMITTTQRGVGRNRNIGLLYATADICLFADDDVIYTKGYREKIIDAFEDIKDADVIIFNLISKNLNRPQRINLRKKRVRLYTALKYPSPRIAVKLESVQKKNIWFSVLFGGGSKYLSGEDSLWLLDAICKGLKVYTHPLVIGEVMQNQSLWFQGYNKEFFFSKGAWCQLALPKLKYFVFLHYILRFRNLKDITAVEMLKMLFAGANSFKRGISYQEWNNKTKLK